MRRLIFTLVRKRLGLRNYEGFQFANQKDKRNWYFFGSTGCLWKIEYGVNTRTMVESGASLNWLLSDECRETIVKNNKWWPDFEEEEG
jgi:hypothetical protein